MNRERTDRTLLLRSGAAELRGHQSVRTTFKLPEYSIRGLALLAGQLGIRQKSLFDHLVEDIETLSAIAAEAEPFSGRSNRVAKTYVISRRTLDNLEEVCRRHNTQRDALVAHCIERVLPLIEQEKEKHRRRHALAAEAAHWLAAGRKLCKQAEAALGADDPATIELRGMLRPADKALENLADMVKKGEEIASWEP